MKKLLLSFCALFALALPAMAQITQTTGTVPSFANGSITATFVNGGGGTPTTTHYTRPVDASGNFRFDYLATNTAPAYAPSTWSFTIQVSGLFSTSFTTAVALVGNQENITTYFQNAPQAAALQGYYPSGPLGSIILLGAGLSFSGNTLNSTGGGSAFPSTPGLLFSTSTTAGRNATFADVVGLFGSGSCGANYLKGDGSCGTGGGGVSTVFGRSGPAISAASGDYNFAQIAGSLGTGQGPALTGLLKDSGGTLSAAVAGTDYQGPLTVTTTGSSGPATLSGNTLNIPQYSGGGGTPGGTNGAIQYNNAGAFGGVVITGLVKGAGTSAPVQAVAGTDYIVSGQSAAVNFGSVSAFTLPSAAGFTAATSGQIGYDTTNGNMHMNVSSTDLFVLGMPKTGVTSGHCAQFTLIGAWWELSDAGAACGSGSGGITALTGDVTASGTGSVAATVVRLNGQSLAALTTGLLKNTTTTGVPTIAVAGTDYVTPTGSGAGLTALNASSLSTGTVAPGLLPLASSSAFGAVEVDGTTITAASGVISATNVGTVTHSTGPLVAGYFLLGNGSGDLASTTDLDDGISTTGFITSQKAIKINDTVHPSSILYAVNGVPPAVTASAAGWGVNATLGTAGFYAMPNAPGTGVWYATNTSGIVQNTFVPLTNTAATLVQTGSGTRTNGDCAQFNSTGDVVDAGAACGTGSSSPSAFSALTDGATVTLATAGAGQSNRTLTMVHTTSTRALNMTGLVSGSYFQIQVAQDSTGGAAITPGTGCTWQNIAGGSTFTPAQAAASVTNISAYYDGTNCFYSQNYPIVTTSGNILSYNSTTGGIAGLGTTGTGSVVEATSPTLVTPTLGAALATSINGNTITTGTGTLTMAAGSTLGTVGAFQTNIKANQNNTTTIPPLNSVLVGQAGNIEQSNGRTTTLGAFTMVTTTTNGIYRVNYSVNCTVASASATVIGTIAYTDTSSTAQTITTPTATCTTLGLASVAQLTQIIRVKTGTNITVAAAISGTPTYDVFASAEILLGS